VLKNYFTRRRNNALNINLCITFVIPYVFTSIQRVKTVLFYRITSVSQ